MANEIRMITQSQQGVDLEVRVGEEGFISRFLGHHDTPFDDFTILLGLVGAEMFEQELGGMPSNLGVSTFEQIAKEREVEGVEIGFLCAALVDHDEEQRDSVVP